MKKEAYILIGIFALVLAGSITAFIFYRHTHLTENSQVDEKTENRPSPDLLITSDSPTKGPPDAKVTIVEFLDPECEACRAMHPVTKKVLRKFEGQVRYIVRYMPFHKNSFFASTVLEATRKQDRFWQALDILFKEQPAWADHYSPKPELILHYMELLKLDKPSLKAEMESSEVAARIRRDESNGRALGVTATPTFFVNGRLLPELSEAALAQLVGAELKSILPNQ